MMTALSSACCRWNANDLPIGWTYRPRVFQPQQHAASNARHSRCAAGMVWRRGVMTLTVSGRLESLERAGLVHPHAGAVRAPLFAEGGFFLAADKVQVKYEMLRAHFTDGVPVSGAARAHGYSRAAFYLVAAAFADAGMTGLLDERRGRRGPVKLQDEIVEFIRAAPPGVSGAVLAEQVAGRFGVVLHRRTVERARAR